MPDDVREVIELLKRAEGRAVKQSDLTALSNTIVSALNEVTAKLTALGATQTTHALAIQAIDGRVTSIESLVKSSANTRSLSPGPRKYDPEETSPGGGLRIAKADWEGVQRLIGEHEKQLKEAEQARRDAELQREAAERVVADQSKTANTLELRRKERRNILIAIATPAVPILLWIGSWLQTWYQAGHK